jgi:phage repressor protein C with HTH and peptisase S24 domain
MFKQKSNKACNNNLFSSRKIDPMHTQMERLYEAAKALKSIGGQSELARALNASPQTVKNWEARGVSKQGLLTAQRVIGCSAVWVETGKGQMQVNEGAEVPASKPDYVSFDMLNVEASAGDGRSMMEFPEVVQRVNVLESWARTALGGDLSRVKLISARGTSMQGTIENGDVLFVDSTVRAYDGDGIYVIARGGDVQVKRLQKLHGDVLAIISDNRAYESERLTGEDANAVVICGRVLSAWTLRKFW